jgi:hypothetical protein
MVAIKALELKSGAHSEAPASSLSGFSFLISHFLLQIATNPGLNSRESKQYAFCHSSPALFAGEESVVGDQSRSSRDKTSLRNDKLFKLSHYRNYQKVAFCTLRLYIDFPRVRRLCPFRVTHLSERSSSLGTEHTEGASHGFLVFS